METTLVLVTLISTNTEVRLAAQTNGIATPITLRGSSSGPSRGSVR